MPIFKAPVALFVYNRLEHTKRTVEALSKNYGASETLLVIFCDGPKQNASLEEITKVRSYVKNIQGFKSVQIYESPANKGLATSIIEGVSYMMENYGEAIVMEDDLVTSVHFLKYMNEGLRKYESDDRVISVHGYVYPTEKTLPETFFLRGADCWGWATWARGWRFFEKDGSKLLSNIRRQHLSREFDFNNAYPYTKMLEDQIAGKNSSWAIRWHASAFLANKLTLYPGRSLVVNIGMDGSGTHCTPSNQLDVEMSPTEISIDNISLGENPFAKKEIEKYFLSQKLTLQKRIKNKISSFLAKIS